MKRHIFTLLALLPLTACQTESSGTAVNLPATPPPSLGGSIGDIAMMQGARAGQAEMGLYNRGYQPAVTQGLTTYWWNAGTQTCARIVTGDGRYQSVTLATAADCDR